MSISFHPCSTRVITNWNSERIHSSSGCKLSVKFSRFDGTGNWLANRATLNNFVNTPKYFCSISSGLIWKSSPTWASQAFQSRKHSEPILFALRFTTLSGPRIFHDPVLPPAPHSSTEFASIPFPRDFDIFLPQGSIPKPSIQICLNPGESNNNALFNRV